LKIGEVSGDHNRQKFIIDFSVQFEELTGRVLLQKLLYSTWSI